MKTPHIRAITKLEMTIPPNINNAINARRVVKLVVNVLESVPFKDMLMTLSKVICLYFLIESLIHLGRILKRRRITEHVKQGRILDIGCGRGLFLNVMRLGGWSVIGTELNEETASYATKVFDLEVLPGGLVQHQPNTPSQSIIQPRHRKFMVYVYPPRTIFI